MASCYRVLLIDDDAMTNRIQTEMIHAADFAGEVAVCPDGHDAIEYLDRSEEGGTFPDVIFLDINMPHMDGWTFLESYRERAYGKQPIIFLQSATLRDEDRERAEKFPEIKQVVKKPVNLSVLDELKALLV